MVQRDDGCGAINDIVTQVKMGIPIILYIVGSSNTKHYFSYFFFVVKSGENE